MSDAQVDQEHTTGWQRLKDAGANAAAGVLETWGPRSTGRRKTDNRKWWIGVLIALLQGGFFLAWRVEHTANQADLAEERRLRAEQHQALVETLRSNTAALERVADETHANTGALQVLLDRDGREGGRR